MFLSQADVLFCQTAHRHARTGQRFTHNTLFICANSTSTLQPHVSGVCGPASMKRHIGPWMETELGYGEERRKNYRKYWLWGICFHMGTWDTYSEAVGEIKGIPGVWGWRDASSRPRRPGELGRVPFKCNTRSWLTKLGSGCLSNCDQRSESAKMTVLSISKCNPQVVVSAKFDTFWSQTIEKEWSGIH